MRGKTLKRLIAIGLITSSVASINITSMVRASELSNQVHDNLLKEEIKESKSYEVLRAKWFDMLTGNSVAGRGDKDIEKNINSMDQMVSEYINTADLSENGNFIWRELIDAQSVSATVTAHFKAIKQMALAYNTIDSIHYNSKELENKILSALNIMYTRHYNENTKMKNNWWDWIIGSPKEVVDVLILMDGKLGDLESGYIKTVDAFIPDVTKRVGQSDSFRETGANLIDKALIVSLRGIIEENDERVEHTATAIHSVFPYVTKGDGFYTDGSFVQHNNIAYTGSYGAELINSLANCLYIIQDTEFKVDTEEYYNLFRWIKDSYEPIFATGGNVIDNVRGRAISRIAQQGDSRGKFMIGAMLKIADIAPNKEAENYIKGITKRWVREGSELSEKYFNGLPTCDIVNMKKVLNNDLVLESTDRNYYKQFYNMDRVVSNRPKYSFNVSMSSKRIANYEEMNQESTKAWYTGQGMTQLYTDDIQQYNEDFWPTVDSMRLPGVTSDGKTRKGYDKATASSWAGGTTVDGLNGVSGMEILPGYLTTEGKATGTSARKSWFMFENEVVALGSNISNSNSEVETIIDNRKIRDDGSNTLLIDGKESFSELGEEGVVKANWAHLEGNVENSDIGYVFPNSVEVTAKRESRTHSWEEINQKPEFVDYEMKTRNYVSLALDHGTNPISKSYEYIILPNATAEKTEKYSKNNPIKVLVNNDNIHAVYHESEKIYAANVFEAGKITDNIEVDGPASIMIKEENGVYKVAVSNPTKEQNSINIIFKELSDDKYEVEGDCIKVDNVITVDTSNKTGETYNFTITPKNVEIVVNPVRDFEESEINKKDVTVTWREPETTEGLEGYILYKDGKKVCEVGTSESSYKFIGLNRHTIYNFKIAAKYENGEVSSKESITLRTKR